MYGGIRYSYSAGTIVKAIEKRDGSMIEWLLKRNRHRAGPRPDPPTTLEKLDAVTTKTEKNKVLTHDLKFTDDVHLTLLVHWAIRVNPKLTLQGGIMDKFVPAKLRDLLEEVGGI